MSKVVVWLNAGGPLVKELATRAIRRQIEADLQKLKAFLEEGTPPAL